MLSLTRLLGATAWHRPEEPDPKEIAQFSEYLGEPLSCYVAQIGARTVNGTDSYFRKGDRVERGQTFGMIRIGSQVDLIVPWRPGLEARVLPGDRVRAGETILIQ
ncbi:MAG TPA: phosphatidylserine decarboxylase [Burkholderiales bacterium]